MIQTLILKDCKTLDGRSSAARGGRRAATLPSTSILCSWHTGNQQKQTARSSSGNPRLPHLEAELSFTSFDIHSAPTARQGEVGYGREEPTAAARRCSVRENQPVVQFCYLTCHWKQSCRVWGLVFQVVFFPLLFLGGVGWQLTRPRGVLLTKREALPGGEGGFYFIFFICGFLHTFPHYLFISLSIISVSIYPTNDAWKFQENKLNGANLAAPSFNARLPSSSLTVRAPISKDFKISRRRDTGSLDFKSVEKITDFY